MNQDDDLILKILCYVRDNADGKKILRVPNCNNYEPHILRYHAQLCAEREYIVLSSTEPLSGKIGILRLTAKGIDHIRANEDFA